MTTNGISKLRIKVSRLFRGKNKIKDEKTESLIQNWFSGASSADKRSAESRERRDAQASIALPFDDPPSTRFYFPRRGRVCVRANYSKELLSLVYRAMILSHKSAHRWPRTFIGLAFRLGGANRFTIARTYPRCVSGVISRRPFP